MEVTLAPQTTGLRRKRVLVPSLVTLSPRNTNDAPYVNAFRTYNRLLARQNFKDITRKKTLRRELASLNVFDPKNTVYPLDLASDVAEAQAAVDRSTDLSVTSTSILMRLCGASANEIVAFEGRDAVDMYVGTLAGIGILAKNGEASIDSMLQGIRYTQPQ